MRRGLWYGVAAYLMWGLFPLFWPLLEPAGPIEILAHRMIWSLLVMCIVVSASRLWGSLRHARPRTWLLVLCAALTISVNWGVYIYAVNNGAVVDASLGYFINPLVSVLLGVLIFAERLRPLQWTAVGLGLAAVLVIALAGGRFPWIALVLAASFATYGLIKKVVPLPSRSSLLGEGLVMALPALIYLGLLQARGTGTLGLGTGHLLLLVSSGVVTVLPLLAFGAAAQALPLSVLGLLQYLTPTVQFLLGVLWAHEQMSTARWVGFVIVWAALALLTADGIRQARRAGRAGRRATVQTASTPSTEQG